MNGSAATIYAGARIKELRVEQGLTLRELGVRSGLSAGYISLLERGLVSASAASLKNIVAALGVEDANITPQCAETAGRVRRGYDQRRFRVPVPGSIYHSLRGDIPEEELRMEPCLFTILPGQRREETCTKNGEAFVYVLEGILTFTAKDKSNDLGRGDSLHIPCRIPHSFANLTNKLVKALCVTTFKIFDR